MTGHVHDCIVVGAGPAGAAAALQLARDGLDVVIIERGKRPGEKNVMSGVLVTRKLHDLVPDFRQRAPLQRCITEEIFCILGQNEVLRLPSLRNYRRLSYEHQAFTVFRSEFDAWFAQEAVNAGAELIPATLVEDLIWENGRVAGVRTRRGDLRARVVIGADGVNSTVAEKSGLRSPPQPAEVSLIVRQVLDLPAEQMTDITGCNVFADDVADWLGAENVVKKYQTLGNAGLSGFEQQLTEWKQRPVENDDLPAVGQDRGMHLRYRRAGPRPRVYRLEVIEDGALLRGPDDLPDLLEVDWVHLVLQPAEGVDVRRRQQVDAGGQKLAELHEGRPHLLERPRQAGGSGHLAAGLRHRILPDPARHLREVGAEFLRRLHGGEEGVSLVDLQQHAGFLFDPADQTGTQGQGRHVPR